MRITTIALLACVAAGSVLAGCAGPRKGPFDVPAAAPGGGGFGLGESGLAGGGYGAGRQDETLRRAADEINAAKVYFAFAKHDLKPEAQQTLMQVADVLKRHPSIRIAIHGHCDQRGSHEYNYALGERRARSAYGFLVRNGVDPCRMDMVTHGKKSPAVSGGSELAMAQNRRDEFIVLTICD